MVNSYEKVALTSDRLKEALELRSMKQIELSEKSGINKPSISCYISGKYDPKQSALYKMGKALDVSEMWLAGYDVPMDRPLEQKKQDELADLVDKLEKDMEFRNLVLKLEKLNSTQFDLIKNMMDAFHLDS